MQKLLKSCLLSLPVCTIPQELYMENFTITALKIVLLNACHSHSQATAISECGISAIGIDNKIMDKTAMIFAKGFYRKYAKTNNITDAIRFGIIQANTTLHGKMDAKDFIHLYQNGQKIQL